MVGGTACSSAGVAIWVSKATGTNIFHSEEIVKSWFLITKAEIEGIRF